MAEKKEHLSSTIPLFSIGASTEAAKNDADPSVHTSQ